ncbi:MAG: hypothetical protein Q9180_008691 [Flavoplaca navasiana]
MFTAKELTVLDALTADNEVVLASLGGKPTMPELRNESEGEKMENGQATEGFLSEISATHAPPVVDDTQQKYHSYDPSGLIALRFNSPTEYFLYTEVLLLTSHSICSLPHQPTKSSSPTIKMTLYEQLQSAQINNSSSTPSRSPVIGGAAIQPNMDVKEKSDLPSSSRMSSNQASDGAAKQKEMDVKEKSDHSKCSACGKDAISCILPKGGLA